MKYFAMIVLVVLLPLGSWADRKGNGGDICEDRFKIVRDDIASWIEKGGPSGLKLPAPLTTAEFSSSMLIQISKSAVTCIDETITVNGSQKTCENLLDENRNSKIICNRTRFLQTNESDQYVLVHHEYAGLAGFETNIGPDSSYLISNQISGFLEDQVVKKLVVRSSVPIGPSPREIRSESMKVGGYTSGHIKKQFEMYKRLLARAGRTIRNIQTGDQNGYGSFFSVKFDHVSTRNLNCSFEIQNVVAGTFGSVESAMSEELNFRDINDSQLIDIEITQADAFGNIAAIRVYFCK